MIIFGLTDLIAPAKTEAGGGGVAELPGRLAANSKALVGRRFRPRPRPMSVHSLDGQTDVFDLNLKRPLVTKNKKALKYFLSFHFELHTDMAKVVEKDLIEIWHFSIIINRKSISVKCAAF